MEQQFNNQPIKAIYPVIVAILITAIVIGGVVYWWQKNATEAEKTALQQQINQLQNQINQVRQESEEDLFKDWQTYRNEEYGFEVKYPKDWSADNNVFYKTDAPRDFYGNIVPIIVIEIEDNLQKLSIDQWIEKNKKDLVISKEGSVIIDGVEGIKVIEGGMVEYLTAYVNKNTSVYSIRISRDSEYLTIFNQVLSSFKFIK